MCVLEDEMVLKTGVLKSNLFKQSTVCKASHLGTDYDNLARNNF